MNFKTRSFTHQSRLALAFVTSLFWTFQVACASDQFIDGSNNQIKPLRVLCGEVIFKDLEKEATGNGDCPLTRSYRGKLQEVQDLVFPKIYTPNYKLLSETIWSKDKNYINMTFLSLMTGVQIPSYTCLSMKLKVDPDFLLSLQTSLYLKSFNVNCNDLGADAGKYVKCLQSFTNLTELVIGSNKLGRNVSCLQTLLCLQTLDVCDNAIAEHISYLQPLTSLTDLSVWGNNLGSHIRSLTVFTNLRRLRAAQNNLDQDISSLQTLTSLTHLDLGNNKIRDRHLGWLPALINLEELEMSNCIIEHASLQIGSLTNLTVLDLSSNYLGQFVTNLQPLAKLIKLDVTDNGINMHHTFLQKLRLNGVRVTPRM